MEHSMAATLNQQVHVYRQMRDRLVSDFPDADDGTLRDTLEGLSNLPEMLAVVVRSYLDDKAIVSGLKARLIEMQERLSRLETRAAKKRDLVTRAMEEADVKQLSEPDFTASLRVNLPSLVIVDEAIIPEDFWVPQPPRLDRQRLRNAACGGQRVPGTELGNAGVGLTVRTK